MTDHIHTEYLCLSCKKRYKDCGCTGVKKVKQYGTCDDCLAKKEKEDKKEE